MLVFVILLIKTNWNVKFIGTVICRMLFKLLIKTNWNVKIVVHEIKMGDVGTINQNKLECKEGGTDRADNLITLLIKTNWNVKIIKRIYFQKVVHLLIKTNWNVKSHRLDSGQGDFSAINQNKLECKVLRRTHPKHWEISINQNKLECKDAPFCDFWHGFCTINQNKLECKVYRKLNPGKSMEAINQNKLECKGGI